MALTVSADKHYVLRDGSPILLWSESAWAMMTQPSLSDVQFFLDDVVGRGINCLNVQLISKRGDNAPNTFANVAPFSTPGNLATLNTTYLDYAASVLDEMFARNMVCLLFPGYLGNGHPSAVDDGWGQILDSEGASKVFNYGAAVATYFASRTNIIWGFGGDTIPDSFTSVNNLYDGVRSVDTSKLALAHWSGGLGFQYSRSETQRAWYDLDVVYTWDQSDLVGVVGDRYAAGLNATMVFEGRYEHNSITNKLLRFQTIASVLNGGCGNTWGNESVWHFTSADVPPQADTGIFWKDDLNTAATQHNTHAGNLFRTRQWWLTVPDTTNTFVVSSRSSGTSYIGARFSSSLGYVYTPAGASFTLDMSEFSRRVTGYWVDPTSGASTLIGGSPFSNTGTQAFSTPGNNAAGDTDWIALFELESLLPIHKWLPASGCPVRR